MRLRVLNVVLTILASAVSFGAMVLLIVGTAFWCVNVEPPLLILGLGIGLVAVAVISATCVADRAALKRLLKPLLLAFVSEYALAFGTLGLGWVSEPLFHLAMWLHYPAGLLASALLSGGGRSVIDKEIALTAVVQWVFIALVFYAVQWYRHRRHVRLDAAY